VLLLPISQFLEEIERNRDVAFFIILHFEVELCLAGVVRFS
jgi:hypothetical protein